MIYCDLIKSQVCLLGIAHTPTPASHHILHTIVPVMVFRFLFVSSSDHVIYCRVTSRAQISLPHCNKHTHTHVNSRVTTESVKPNSFDAVTLQPRLVTICVCENPCSGDICSLFGWPTFTNHFCTCRIPKNLVTLLMQRATGSRYTFHPFHTIPKWEIIFNPWCVALMLLMSFRAEIKCSYLHVYYYYIVFRRKCNIQNNGGYHGFVKCVTFGVCHVRSDVRRCVVVSLSSPTTKNPLTFLFESRFKR